MAASLWKYSRCYFISLDIKLYCRRAHGGAQPISQRVYFPEWSPYVSPMNCSR